MLTRHRWLVVGLAVCSLANRATGAIITFGGNITQSTQDGTGPAVNNPVLNNIQDLQAYAVTLAFAGSITAPGMYDLTGSAMTFTVPAALATETSFGSVSLTVSADGLLDDISLLGCLTTGSDCAVGNQLTANLQILATGLNSQNVTATGLDQPGNLDARGEDTDVTRINTGGPGALLCAGPNAAPEPSTARLSGRRCSLSRE